MLKRQRVPRIHTKCSSFWDSKFSYGVFNHCTDIVVKNIDRFFFFSENLGNVPSQVLDGGHFAKHIVIKAFLTWKTRMRKAASVIGRPGDSGRTREMNAYPDET